MNGFAGFVEDSEFNLFKNFMSFKI
jgi:hypothetical protein